MTLQIRVGGCELIDRFLHFIRLFLGQKRNAASAFHCFLAAAPREKEVDHWQHVSCRKNAEHIAWMCRKVLSGRLAPGRLEFSFTESIFQKSVDTTAGVKQRIN